MSEQTQPLEEQRFEQISGYIDGELTQQEAQKISLLIESDPSYQSLYRELLVMRQQVQSLSLQEQELEHLNKLFIEPVAKTSRILGFVLIVASALCLVGFTLFKIMVNPDIGLVEKILVAALGSGGLLLLFSVLRQRMLSKNNDKYQNVNF